MIVTFYSFKGGVGRSMALVNVGEILANEGYDVVLCDWDLEAPGLERYLVANRASARRYRRRQGVIDLLLEYQQTVSRAQEEDSPGAEALEPPPGFARIGKLLLRRPSSQLVTVRSDRPRRGRLRLLTAGRRDGEANNAYTSAVQTFGWREFYRSWAGGSYLEFFRKDLEADSDIVLVDSRTGVTEQGGVCTHHLADLVILMTASNDLNLEGTAWMADALANPELVDLRGGRKLDVLPVAARVEQTSEKEELVAFRRQLRRDFSKYLPRSIGDRARFFADTEIPYIPYYAFTERVAARELEEEREQHLYDAYENLAKVLLRLGAAGDRLHAEASKLRLKRRPERARSTGGLAQFEHEVFISYAAADDSVPLEGERGWVEEFTRHLDVNLFRRLGRQPHIWRDERLSGSQKFVREIRSALENSAVLVTLITPSYLASDYSRSELELFVNKARAEPMGLTVGNRLRLFPVLLHGVKQDDLPKVLQGVRGYRFYDESGWPLEGESQDYNEAIRKLVTDLSEMLELLDSAELPTDSETEIGDTPTIFLAMSPDNLAGQRRLLAQQLKEVGYTVLPTMPPPFEDDQHARAVEDALQRADLSVHLLSEYPGVPLDESDPATTYPVEQARIAFELGRSQIVFLPREVSLDQIEEPSYAQFIRSLQEEVRPTAEVVRGTPVDLLAAIEDAITRSELPQAQPRERAPVVVDLHQRDLGNITDLLHYLEKNELPTLMTSGADRETLERHLEIAGWLLVVHGAVDANWVRGRLELALQLQVTHDLAFPVGVLALPQAKADLTPVNPWVTVFDATDGLDEKALNEFFNPE